MKRASVFLFGLVLVWVSLATAFADSLSGGNATTGAAFGTTRVVTGATDTATSADYYGFIAWRSATGGTQTLPACASGNNGKWIGVIDEQGNATSSHITFTAPSSTVASNASIGVNNGGVIIQCDGTAATWSTISSAGALANRNPQSRSDLLTLTDAANITIPSCAGGYQLSLGGSGHTLGGLPAGCTVAGFLNSMLLEVTIPSGCPTAGCTLNFATGVGYTIPGDQVSGCGANCITLSAGPGCIDDLSLIPVGTAAVRISDPTKCQTAVSAPPSFAIVSHDPGLTGCAHVSTCAGGSVTFTSLTNQVAIVGIPYCDVGTASSCASGTTQGATVSTVTQTGGTATSTCARIPGIAGPTDPGAHTTQDVFICAPTALGASGTATYTANLSAVVYGPQLMTVVVSGVTTASSIGKAAVGTAANPSVTTTGTTPQSGMFLISFATAIGASMTPGAGYTQIDNGGGSISQWSVSGAINTTVSASIVTSGTVQGSTISVAPINHP
jgi:hypothetical protein